MLKPLREDPERERLHLCDGLCLRGAVDHDARQHADLGNPAAVGFLFERDIECHRSSERACFNIPLGGRQPATLAGRLHQASLACAQDALHLLMQCRDVGLHDAPDDI